MQEVENIFRCGPRVEVTKKQIRLHADFISPGLHNLLHPTAIAFA